MLIKDITIQKILNSLGEWSLETHFYTKYGVTEASVPRGKSEGKYEAMNVEAEEAIQNLKHIKSKITNVDFKSIREFDEKLIELDGTANKGNLGANLILALSIAAAKSFALENKQETFEYISKTSDTEPNIPKFSLLIFEGGKHGSQFLTIQEFMLITDGIEDAKKTLDVFETYLKGNGLFVGFGLEGAFTSSKLHDVEVLDLLKALAPNKQIALDIAESSREGDIIDFKHIVENYNILSIEDPKHEEDYKGWKNFCKEFGDKILVVADDLTTTNKLLIQNAQKEQLANAVIIKPNQIGTVTETVEAVKQARSANWKIIVSHRGGDTNDDFISDFAVGIGADYVKFGGLERGERIAKYNRILEIENL